MNHVDVLVVGAGPAGLFLAGELVRKGHSCTIVECNTGPSTQSKALAIMPRTLELFERAGINDPFLAEVNRVRGVRFVTPRGAAYVAFEKLPTRYPFISILPQWKTEAILSSRLQHLGGTILYGNEFDRFERGERGLRAFIRDSNGMHELSARYLAGCDGVHSAVRACAQIPFAGYTYQDHAVLADVLIETAVPPDEARVHMDRAGMVTLFPINAALRRIVVVSLGEALPEHISSEWLQKRVDRAGLHGTVVRDLCWSSVFGVHRRVAQRMRAGAVFLAGDAAHAHSPVGGQGMNVGLEDAFALAEALSPVLHGRAPESSLDRYEAQRLPVARAVVRQTDLLLRAVVHPSRIMRVGREMFAPYIIRIPVLQRRVVRNLLTA